MAGKCSSGRPWQLELGGESWRFISWTTNRKQGLNWEWLCTPSNELFPGQKGHTSQASPNGLATGGQIFKCLRIWVGNLIQTTTVYFMNGQMLCPEVGSGQRQKRREKEMVLDKWVVLEVVAYVLVEEVCVLPYSSVTNDEVAGHGTGKLE